MPRERRGLLLLLSSSSVLYQKYAPRPPFPPFLPPSLLPLQDRVAQLGYKLRWKPLPSLVRSSSLLHLLLWREYTTLFLWMRCPRAVVGLPRCGASCNWRRQKNPHLISPVLMFFLPPLLLIPTTTSWKGENVALSSGKNNFPYKCYVWLEMAKTYRAIQNRISGGKIRRKKFLPK